MTSWQRYESPLGTIFIVSDEIGLTQVTFDRLPDFSCVEDKPSEETNPFIQTAITWLNRYFNGERPTQFPPLHPKGTIFQKQVWQMISTIPYGSISTYGELKERWECENGKTMSARAIGQAAGKNPIAIFIPCHRVVGQDYSMTGYAWGDERKRDLLQMESRHVHMHSLEASSQQDPYALFEALRIRPHFVANVLNCIYALVDTDPDQAKEAIVQLSSALKEPSLLDPSLTTVPLEDEIRWTRFYVYLQHLRYRNLITIHTDIETTDYVVPPFALETLVENAIAHGLLPKPEGGNLWVSSKAEGNMIHIIIRDDGVGFEYNNNTPLKGVGLQNAIRRLETIVHAKVHIDSKVGVGTTIDIQIPQEAAHENRML